MSYTRRSFIHHPARHRARAPGAWSSNPFGPINATTDDERLAYSTTQYYCFAYPKPNAWEAVDGCAAHETG